MMSSLTRWVLAHKRTVAVFWVALTIAGVAAAGPASDALETEFSVPDKEGWETNVAISERYAGTGGDNAPLLPVVTLPQGTTADSPGVQRELERLDTRLERALPGSRIASYTSTGDKTFVSDDGRTVYSIVHPRPARDSTFGENPKAERAARNAIDGATVAGQPVHLTGFDALAEASGEDSGGPGVLLEAVLGAAGALIVLGFVFASFLAFVPLVMAAVSIMTTFLLLYGLTQVTAVSPIVQFLIALIGLGVAIDYSLLVVSRWREERSHGRSGDEAVQKAMETAGRAVVFSGVTVAIGLFALIALPLPFLRSMGYGGMLIPLVSTLVAITLLPVVLAKLGPRLDWPHRRTDDKASRAWTRWAEAVSRRRWVAAGAGMAVIVALAFAATDLQLGTSDADTVARSGDAKEGLVALERAGIGEGALLPNEILIDGGTDPERVASDLSRVEGIHGAVAPDDADWRRAGTALVEAVPVPAGGQRRLRRRRLRQLPADDRPDHDHDLHPAGAGVPVAAAAGQGDRAQRAQRRRRVGRARARLAARLRLGGDLGHPGHRLDPLLDAADGVRLPVRAVHGLRGVHPQPHARGVRPNRLDPRRGRAGHRPNGTPGHERGADPVPVFHVDGLGARDRREDDGHRARRGDPAGRDGHQGAYRSGGDSAHGPLELVAAEVAGAAAAGRAVAAAAGRSR
jgi:RND superfamily putative drug exporter